MVVMVTLIGVIVIALDLTMIGREPAPLQDGEVISGFGSAANILCIV